jgi:lauroyl/myristoyl acyltransferase
MSSELNPVHAALSHAGVLCLRALGFVVRHLPPAVWGMTASALAPVLWLGLKKHRVRALRNLTEEGHSPREARRLGRASFRSNLLVFFEALAMSRIRAREGIRVDLAIAPEAEKVLERIRGGEETVAFGLSGHLGVWEILGMELARLCEPTPVVISSRLVKNPILTRYLRGLREGFGLTLIEKDEFVRYLIRHARAREPRVYVFLCDQHQKGGLSVPFMGRPACTVAVPATFHLKYGGPMLYGKSERIAPGHYAIEVHVLDTAPFSERPNDEAVFGITAFVNDYLGESIRKVPEQWTWAHRRWRDCCVERSGG